MSAYLTSPLPLRVKVRLAGRVWRAFAGVRFSLRRYPLPLAVEQLSRCPRPLRYRLDPGHLGRVVARTLKVRSYQPRCLFGALVLYQVLTDQGECPVLVIGLPEEPTDADAHAWVELDGRDVGPPPGASRGYIELARYGGAARPSS